MASWLNDLHALIKDIEDRSLAEVVNDILLHVNEPFLFVVVGEIKAGKSSFINALLDTDICRVDPAPCTDTIQQIVFADQQTETIINPHHRKIGLPASVLRHVSIVDTPGTNTVIEHHHEITERYIPNSGLVLFVFPAKNPHTRTAWDLLDYVSEQWRKIVVFVLQQADLATENELRINMAKVREYAEARGIQAPVIFAVSAKWEEEKNPKSGFDPVRTYIRETVTGGRHLYLKLSTTLASGEQALRRVYDALKVEQARLEADRGVAERIRQVLETGKKNSERDIEQFVDILCGRYDRIGLEIRSDFEEGLSVAALYRRAVSGAFNRKKSVTAWLEELQSRFENRLAEALMQEVGERSLQFMETIQDTAGRIDEVLGQSLTFPIGKKRKGLWNEKRAELVTEIRRRIDALAAKDLFHETLVANPADMPSRLMSGGAFTLLGALLLTTHVGFLDITGGILTGFGLIMTGAVLVAKRGKIIREFSGAIQQGRDQFRDRLIQALSERFLHLHTEISESVKPFLTHIEAQERHQAELMARGEALQQRMQLLSQQINNDMEAG